jgi:serine/threonine-protein kinase
MKVVGRYALLAELARGGMASVHFGRLQGPGGFGRAVAIKRLHAHLGGDPQFQAMLLDEARLAARIQHKNVVAMLDVVAEGDEVLLVMEHVDGETLQRLLAPPGAELEAAPAAIASAILCDVLRGLHAAHQVTDESGEPLGLVHRDVSPQNIMVRRDGTTLVVDFGVAKAAGRFQTTEHGTIKGKLPYMAPEQVRAGPLTRKSDVYAAGAVLWEALVGRRLFGGSNDGEVIERLLFAEIEAPGAHVPGIAPALDAVVLRALERDPAGRFESAAEMAEALAAAQPPATAVEVAAWVDARAGEQLRAHDKRLAALLARGREVEAPRSVADASAAASAASPDAAMAPMAETSAGEAALDATRTGFSSIGIAAGAPSGRWAPWGAGALAAVAVVAAWLVLGARGPAAALREPLHAAVAAAAQTRIAAIAEVEPAVTANDDATATPAASTAAAAAPARPAAPMSGRGGARPRSKPGKCQPYRVDAAGHRIYNLDCLP